MDIEKLNKSQIVLLTLLVSFMTSIATGIVTVSLMQQAPPAITETVNRVVERTIERVVPGQTAAAATPETKMVIVKESDLIAQAVAGVSPSVVRFYTQDASNTPIFLAMGVVIDGSGTIATDSGAVGGPDEAFFVLEGSLKLRASVQSRDASTGIAYVTTATSTPDGHVMTWRPAKIATESPKLGQTVILVGGKSSTRVGQGLVSAVSPLSDSLKDVANVIETDIAKDGILSGSPIIDTDGTVLGVSTKASRASNESGFISGSSIVEQKDTAKTKETPVSDE